MLIDKTLIYGFSETFLKSSFDNPVKVADFHFDLWDALCCKEDWVAIAAPRGHSKSTSCTIVWLLSMALFRQADHILIISDTETQAAGFLGNIRSHLTENKELISAFHIAPVEQWDKDTESEIVFSFESGEKCRIFARGSEQGIRGMLWKNKRPNLIIADDFENDDMVMSEERRTKFIAKFLNKIVPLGRSSGTKIRIVGTILHTDSLLENLLTNFGNDSENREWDGLVEKPTKKSTNPWYSLRFKAHNEDFSEILWPEKFNKESLNKIRTLYVNSGNIEGYSCEYLNNPIDQQSAYFKKDDMKHIKEDGQNETMYISCDLAISSKDGRAFTAMIVVGVTQTGVIRVRDVKRFRGDALEIIDTLFYLVQRWKPDLVFLEAENIARTLGSILYDEMQKRQTWFSIEASTASQDKIKRARSLQARYRSGTIEFDSTKDWYYELAKELFDFPKGKYMDQVDALSWACIGTDKLISAPTHQELYEEEYSRHMEEVGLNQGQSKFTGY
jgi:predicted phage terminase large subunit-like protein